jgi:heme o synthase
MKATVQSLGEAAGLEKSRFAVLCELVKIRLTFLVLLTTLVGFYVGTREALDYVLMIHTVLATGLVACGAAALNQLWEREHDAKMKRTENRPLPSGRLQPETVLIFGGACSGVGLVYLALAVNLLTALLGALTLSTYLLVYTPLKRITWLNTAVGAVPGALPPVMGWAAARGEVTADGWSLFAILFFWQIPHFLAIAWIYREEYARAGFAMLPTMDPDGLRTGLQTVSHTLALLLASVCPVAFHLAGVTYFAGALVLGLIFLAAAWKFSRHLTVQRARQLFFVSILYLPLLLGLMVLDKVRL